MKTDGSNKKWIGNGREPNWLGSNDMILGIINETNYWQFIIYNIPDSISTRLPFNNRDIRAIDYSIERKQITFWTANGIWIMNADGSDPKRIIPSNLYGNSSSAAKKLLVYGPSWHPDGKQIVYEHYRATRIEYNNVQGLIAEGYYSLRLVDVD